jgi:hypothetical protein
MASIKRYKKTTLTDLPEGEEVRSMTGFKNQIVIRTNKAIYRLNGNTFELLGQDIAKCRIEA